MPLSTINRAGDRVDEAIEVLIPEVRRRARRRRLFTALVAVALAAVLVTGILVLVEPSDRARSPLTSPGSTGPTGGLTSGAPITASAPALEVYFVVHGPVAWNPQIFAKPVGSREPTQLITRGLSAQVISSAGGDNVLNIYTATGSPNQYLYRVRSNDTLARMGVSNLDRFQQGGIYLAVGKFLYVDEYDQLARINTQTSAIAPLNQNIRPFANPYNVAAPLRCGESISCAFDATDGLVLDSGRLYALSYSGRSAWIVDLTTGLGRAIPYFDYLRGAAIGPDGHIYAVAWRGFDQSATLAVLRIDPNTLQVVDTFNTGVLASGVDSVDIQSTAAGSALVYVARQIGAKSVPMAAYLWSASGAGLTSFGSLPDNIGLDMKVYGSNVYLFGGPAKNDVSRLNLANGHLTRDILGLRTPKDSYVLALD